MILTPAVALNTSLGKGKTEHTFFVSPTQPLPVLSWGVHKTDVGLTFSSPHLISLPRALKYPVNPLPQNPLERISMGAILSAMPWLFYWQRKWTASNPALCVSHNSADLSHVPSASAQRVLPHSETVSYFWSFPSAFSESLNASFIRMRGSKWVGWDGGINEFIPIAEIICFFPETTGQNLKCPSKMLTAHIYIILHKTDFHLLFDYLIIVFHKGPCNSSQSALISLPWIITNYQYTFFSHSVL